MLVAKPRLRFVEMPNVVTAWGLALQTASVLGTESHRPRSDRLVGDDNAPLDQHLLDQTQAQRKTKIVPNR
jgi:hypothetical protein